MAVAATCIRAHASWQGGCNADMRCDEMEQKSVLCGLRDVGVMWTQWDNFLVDGVPISCRTIRSDAVRKHMSRFARKGNGIIGPLNTMWRS